MGIAESRARINASRLMVLSAAWKIDNLGFKAAQEEISVIKFFVAGVLDRVLDRAIQVHGALGLTEDTVLSFWYRHERAARIYDKQLSDRNRAIEIYREITSHETDPKRINEANKRLADLSGTRKS